MKPVVKQTKKWLEDIVIKHNFCPFAKKELLRDSIRFYVIDSSDMAEALQALVDEFFYLDNHTETETTLVILPNGFNQFDDYLDLVALANALLEDQEYSGIYQLASFHPDYCFEGTDNDDPANYTNRSPYPTLHIIRETSLARAIASHPDVAGIPEQNIAYARKLGRDKLQSDLDLIRN
ncbi:MAG: DUF1415 domain-containing protein [Aquificaceae bacterium]|nr:MAG: DUF1415 domain-containing protein [Aquificaceae bacterium]